MELMQAWQIYFQVRGNPDARDALYRQIWDRYHKRILCFLRQRVPDEAEDLLQDVMLRVFENLDRYKPTYSFSTWIFTIARNQMINRMRKKRPPVSPVTESVPDSQQRSPEDRLIGEENRRMIESLIQTLDPDQRQMVYLYYYEALRIRRIAQIMDLPVGTVKSRLYWIRNQLRNKLGEINE